MVTAAHDCWFFEIVGRCESKGIQENGIMEDVYVFKGSIT